MLLFNKWMGECLDLLKKAPSILDRRLAAWVELQRIADDTSTSFGFDDPSTDINITDSRMQTIIKSFERRMEDWKRVIVPEIMDGKLFRSTYILRLITENALSDFDDRVPPKLYMYVPICDGRREAQKSRF